MPNPLSYRIGHVQTPALPLERVTHLGIRWLEISMSEGQTVEEVLEILRPHDLRVATVSTSLKLSDEDVFTKVEKVADQAAGLGALGLFASVQSGGLPLPEAYANLRRIGDIVAARKLFIAMETHPDLCENGDQAAKTLSQVNHPACGWNIDTANIYYYNENVDSVTEARKAAQYVRAVHAKDTYGGFKSAEFPNVGEGVVDFAGVGQVLREVGFTGPYTLELEGIAGSADTVELMEANVAACAGHLRGLGLVE